MNDQSKKAFILKMGELSTLFGFSHVLGQIYGVLYMNARELSLDNIKDTLSVSKATVSLNIRELLKWGAVKKIWKPGTRKDYYEVEADFLKIFNTRLVDALLRRVQVFKDAAFMNEKEEENAKSKEDRIIENRLKDIRKISRILVKILESAKDTKKINFIQKFLM